MAPNTRRSVLTCVVLLTLTSFVHANGPPKTATAYQGKPNDIAKPTITITDRHINIELKSRPAATVKGVQFAGSGDTFNFSKSGDAEIEPGTYTIVVEGSVGISTQYPDGRIEAIIHYH